MAQLFSFRFGEWPRALALLTVGGLLAGTAHAQSVRIGAGGAPDPQAALDIQAADKGLLIPRLDSAQRATLTPPSDGLMVFQKDGRVGLWYAFGGTWFYIPDKIKASDNLGNHTATRAFNLQNQLLVGANTLNGAPSTTGLRIDGTGRVGIATDAGGPQQLLQLGSTTSGRPAFLRVAGGNGTAQRQWELGMNLNPGNLSDISGDNYDFSIRDVTGNQTRLLIDYVTGRVGIGTTSPANTLHVVGGARFTGMAGPTQRLVTVNAAGDLVASSTIPAGIPGDNLGDHLATQPLAFSSADDDKILFIGSYGVNGPKISHSAGWNLDYYAGSTGGNAVLKGTHRFFSGGAVRVERMRLSEAGWLGIGTTAPRGLLDVGTASDIYLTANTADGASRTVFMPGSLYLAPYNTSTNTTFIQARIPTPTATTNLGIQLRTTNNGAVRDALKVNPDGKVGIGTTTPAYALDVAGPVQAQSYRYAASQVRYLTVPATAFVAAAPTYSTAYAWAGSGAQVSATYVSLTGGTAGQPGNLVAPVNLPEGAIITGLALSAFDKDNTALAPSATLTVLDNQATVLAVATAQLTAETNAPQTVLQAYNHTVLNQTNSYSLTVQLNQNSPATRLICVRIAYTIQQP